MERGVSGPQGFWGTYLTCSSGTVGTPDPMLEGSDFSAASITGSPDRDRKQRTRHRKGVGVEPPDCSDARRFKDGSPEFAVLRLKCMSQGREPVPAVTFLRPCSSRKIGSEVASLSSKARIAAVTLCTCWEQEQGGEGRVMR